MEQLFFALGLIIITASILAYLTKLMKQPMVPAYIIAGIIIGPVLKLITNSDTIAILSEIGIAFLLFIVGLEIDINKLKSVAFVSSVAGIGKSVVLFGLAYLTASLLGFLSIEAMYIGLIVVFSSTMVVVKLMADKRELDTMHGRVLVGILLIEDILAVLIMSFLTTIDNFSFMFLAAALLKGIGILVFAALLSKFILPKLFKYTAESQELLFLVSLTMCFLFGLLFNWIGFSIAIGAFVAGVALGNLPYNFEIISRVKPLRDFFSTIFFVSLGLNIVFDNIGKIILLAIILFLLIVLIKPLIIMFFVSLFGYKKRPAFLISASLIQISEFSMIVLALGLSYKHISQEIFTLAVILAIFTITLTTYVIKYEHRIYDFIKYPLYAFEKLNMTDKDLKEQKSVQKQYDVIMCGHNRIAYGIIDQLKKMKRSVLVIDYNPDVIRHLFKQKVDAMYGDIGDIEIVDKLDFRKTKMMISTVHDSKDSVLMMRKAKKENKDCVVILTANYIHEALSLYKQGADYVILPHILGGTHHDVAAVIEGADDGLRGLVKHRLRHIKKLKRRRMKQDYF